MKSNRTRRNWFVLAIVLEMAWLCAISLDDFSLNGFNLKVQAGAKSAKVHHKWIWNFTSVVILGLGTTIVGWISFRHEIKTKYTALFQQLFEFQPKSEIYGGVYKTETERLYRSSLRDALIMISKTLLPLLYIVLVGVLISRVLLVDQIRMSGVKGSTDPYLDNLLDLYGKSEFLKTKISQNYKDVFTTSCRVFKSDMVTGKVGLGFGLLAGESLTEKLENQSFSKIIDYLILRSMPLGIEIFRVVLVLTGWSSVIGKLVWIFYLSKVEPI